MSGSVDTGMAKPLDPHQKNHTAHKTAARAETQHQRYPTVRRLGRERGRAEGPKIAEHVECLGGEVSGEGACGSGVDDVLDLQIWGAVGAWG